MSRDVSDGLKLNFSEEESKAFDKLLEDYKNSSFKIYAKFFHNKRIIADLIKKGWRKP